ncbi:1091_t:CDS:1, partial [Racocetra persica]
PRSPRTTEAIYSVVNFYEPSLRITEITEALINQETTTTHLGTSHAYNNIATTLSFGTTDAFIGTTGAFVGQELTQNNPNTIINTTIPSYGQGQTLDYQTPIITSNNPYETTTTEELQFFYPTFEPLHIYDYNLLRAAKATAEAFAEATVDRFIVYNRNLLLETAEEFIAQDPCENYY